MGGTAPVTTSVEESNAQATPPSAPRLSVDGENPATVANRNNEKPTGSISDHTTVAVASEDGEGLQEGPLTSFFRVLYEFSTPSDA